MRSDKRGDVDRVGERREDGDGKYKERGGCRS